MNRIGAYYMKKSIQKSMYMLFGTVKWIQNEIKSGMQRNGKYIISILIFGSLN